MNSYSVKSAFAIPLQNLVPVPWPSFRCTHRHPLHERDDSTRRRILGSAGPRAPGRFGENVVSTSIRIHVNRDGMEKITACRGHHRVYCIV